MSRRFACSNGHTWLSEEPSDGGESTRVLPQCPHCGLSGEVYHTNGKRPPGSKDVPTSRLDSDEVRFTSAASHRFGSVKPPALPGYEIQEEIGRGGMGVVYRAVDLKRGGLVAVKYLPRPDPSMLLRFKQEFRSVADLSHPNLAAVHELRQVDGNWCLVMELVEGQPFTERYTSIASLDERVKHLGAGLRQLVEGLRFLHESGLLHCDVKPTNVIVTPKDRVALLDFGLVAEWKPERQEGATGELVGSLGYIAPERFAGKPATAATDWYAVGVILYETLVGRRPFQGSRTNLIWQQQHMEPPPPADVIAGVPEGWSELCAALIQRDPAKRAGAEAILSFLDGDTSLPRPRGDSLRVRDLPLVGRDRQLAQLQSAWEAADSGQCAVVRVRGRTGMGKSTLVERFLDRLTHRESVSVLKGRCYEQESVPYKALDGLIDSLCQFLAQFETDALAPLVPEGMGSLSKMFPVLRRLRLGSVHWRVTDHADPAELRRQAGQALRQLFANLAQHQPLILWLDDLQWGDADSARLLEELLRTPQAPALMLIAGYRSEETAGPWPQALAELKSSPGVLVFDADPNELTELEANSLAQALLADDSAADEELATAIGRESRGWPLLVLELTRHYRERLAHERIRAAISEITLDRVIHTRMSGMTGAERQLLGVLAVAGQPVREGTSIRAAELPGEPLTAMNRLRAGHWVKTSETGADHWVECYHDGVREAVIKAMTAEEQAANHDRLARAYAAAYPLEHVLLAVHCLGAGRAEEAADHYVKAADEASEALAFDRAAQLYRVGLDLRTRSPQETGILWRKLGDALANAGQGSEAARAYITACHGFDRTTVLQLKRRAAYQLCVSGHFDEGLRALHEVLQAGGLSLPSSPRRATLALAAERLRLRWRGLEFQERAVEDVSADELERIDLCWAATAGLSLFDVIGGAYFQAVHLRHALDSGEPFRLTRALSWQAAHISTDGLSAATRASRFLEAARVLATGLNNAHALAMHALAEGIVHHNLGQWQVAQQCLLDAGRMFRAHCTGVAWERDVACAFQAWSLYQLGRFKDLIELADRLGQDAMARHDRFAGIHLAAFAAPIARLAAGDSIGARRLIQHQSLEAEKSGSYLPQITAMMSECRIDLYEGKIMEAWNRLTSIWQHLTVGRFVRVQQLRVTATHLRGAVAAALAQGSQRDAMLKRAERDAAALDKELLPWATAFAKSIRGAIQFRSGDTPAASDWLTQSADDLERQSMLAFAAAARFWCGKLANDATRILEAEQSLRECGASNPENMATMLVPGFAKC